MLTIAVEYQESLENSDGRSADDESVGVCDRVCVHFVLEEKQWRVWAARAFDCRRKRLDAQQVLRRS